MPSHAVALIVTTSNVPDALTQVVAAATVTLAVVIIPDPSQDDAKVTAYCWGFVQSGELIAAQRAVWLATDCNVPRVHNVTPISIPPTSIAIRIPDTMANSSAVAALVFRASDRPDWGFTVNVP